GAVPGISYGGAGSATALGVVPPAALVLAGIDPNAVAALSKVGLAGVGVPANDEMVSARIDFPLWDSKIKVGGNWLIDGLLAEEAFSVDLGFTLWDRLVKFEWAKTGRYANDGDTNGDDDAMLINAELLKWNGWKLWGSYADAGAGFQAPTASIANPYARTASEALFDRPAAFGAP
ncbi:MAG: hypothetical protein COZ05_06360, partial [Armatimonadetes bacterium CG_4_10_14_3_um_filter_59_10]